MHSTSEYLLIKETLADFIPFILSFCLFILFMGFSRQEHWSGLPFPSPVDHYIIIKGSVHQQETFRRKKHMQSNTHSWFKKEKTSQKTRNRGKFPQLDKEYLQKFTVNIILNCERLNLFAQSCPTLCNPMDCSLPGSSVHGNFQARILEWVDISYSRGSS